MASYQPGDNEEAAGRRTSDVHFVLHHYGSLVFLVVLHICVQQGNIDGQQFSTRHLLAMCEIFITPTITSRECRFWYLAKVIAALRWM